jgi:FixJ family two-component response regulator
MKEKISVLVVDDEPGIRILLHNLLKDMGLGDVRVSGRGEDALKILMREKVDLMLLDFRMPGMDGQETSRRSLQVWPDLVILIVTGYATVESAVELMKNGVFDIVRKPFQYEEFKEKVDKALAEVERRTQERAAKQALQRFGRYVILSEVSRGGMGVVYKARSLDNDRVVALKVLEAQKSKPEQVARFYLEGDTIAKLRHPGIVQIQDMGICEGHHFIAMEFIDGVSLYDLIYGNELSYRRGLRILAEVLEALQYAHSQGVIHRDLKPSNIIVDKAGQSHLIDFGLAKFMGGRIKITQTDLILGTFGYLAPERLVGDSVDHRADIYSMGAILYEMLTHRLPYEKEDDVHVFPVFEAGAVPPSAVNRDVPPDLEAICLKAIAVRREERYQAAAEFGAALEEFLAGLGEDRPCR